VVECDGLAVVSCDVGIVVVTVAACAAIVVVAAAIAGVTGEGVVGGKEWTHGFPQHGTGRFVPFSQSARAQPIRLCS